MLKRFGFSIFASLLVIMFVRMSYKVNVDHVTMKLIEGLRPGEPGVYDLLWKDGEWLTDVRF